MRFPCLFFAVVVLLSFLPFGFAQDATILDHVGTLSDCNTTSEIT